METKLLRSETDLLIFISSVMDELKCARQVVMNTCLAFPFTQPWAFEFTPASSELPIDGYLRKVKEADFVIWLIGRKTTQPVVDEITTCISAGRRLLAFKLPSESRCEETQNLINEVGDYAKWAEVNNIDNLAEHIQKALSDEFVNALRDPAPPARRDKLQEMKQLSISRCQRMWTSLGVPDNIATELTNDPSVGDILEELPGPGVYRIEGDQGSGKTLAVERLFQKAVTCALNVSSQPFPIFVNARSLSEPIADYIDQKSQGYSCPSVQGILIIIDGLDEIGVYRADSVLEQVAIYTYANPKATAVVTIRPLPRLKSDIGERILIPPMDDKRCIDLVSRIADRELKSHERHAWSVSIWEAAKRPLFAVMIGSELYENPDFNVPQPVHLVKSLAERALQKAENPEIVDTLLQQLAVKAINSGKRVHLRDVCLIRARQKTLIDSRLVNEEDGTVDFTLSIFREWYAAIGLVEQTISLDDIQLATDRWIIPLSIACDLGDEALEHSLMVRLASSDPGLASLVLKEFAPIIVNTAQITAQGPDPISLRFTNLQHSWSTDEIGAPFLGTSVDTGEEIRQAMETWGQGLGRLYSFIGPVGPNGNTATLGIKFNGSSIYMSWYKGTRNLPAVVDLPDEYINTDNLDWSPSFPIRVPHTKWWPWIITKDYLISSLADKIKSKQLALESKSIDAVREFSWAFARAVKRQGDLDPTPINIHEILRYIEEEAIKYEPLQFESTDFYLNEHIRIIQDYLSELAKNEENIITDPWPSADQRRGRREIYSPQRLLERTNAIYAGALRIYKKMVDQWFKAFDTRLHLNRYLPVRLEGQLELLELPLQHGVNNPVPRLIWYPRALPIHEESTVEFGLCPQEGFIDDPQSYWNDEENRLKQIRPDRIDNLSPKYSIKLLQYSNSISEPLSATKLALDWLSSDLRELDWGEKIVF